MASLMERAQSPQIDEWIGDLAVLAGIVPTVIDAPDSEDRRGPGDNAADSPGVERATALTPANAPESVLQLALGDQWHKMSLHVPRYTYCATSCRFGQCIPPCLDCSGSQFVAYRDGPHLAIPTSTSTISQWGRAHGQVRPIEEAIFGDLLIHATNGDPYHSDGPIGHVGGFVRWEIIGGALYAWTWESASSQHGWGLYRRPAHPMWLIAVRHYALANAPIQPAPPTSEDDDMKPYLARGDLDKETVWLTDEMTKRWIDSPDYLSRIVKRGMLQRNDVVPIAQYDIDSIPAVGRTPAHYAGTRA